MPECPDPAVDLTHAVRQLVTPLKHRSSLCTASAACRPEPRRIGIGESSRVSRELRVPPPGFVLPVSCGLFCSVGELEEAAERGHEAVEAAPMGRGSAAVFWPCRIDCTPAGKLHDESSLGCLSARCRQHAAR